MILTKWRKAKRTRQWVHSCQKRCTHASNGDFCMALRAFFLVHATNVATLKAGPPYFLDLHACGHPPENPRFKYMKHKEQKREPLPPQDAGNGDLTDPLRPENKQTTKQHDHLTRGGLASVIVKRAWCIPLNTNHDPETKAPPHKKIEHTRLIAGAWNC